MSELKDILKAKRLEARELITEGSSRLAHEGLGMINVIRAIREWTSRERRAKKFMYGDNTIVKDGYVYVRVTDIPFDNLYEDVDEEHNQDVGGV